MEVEQKTDFGKQAYKLLGEEQGCRALAETFYGIMDKVPEAQRIRNMHAPDLQHTCDNFTLFLCGWLGGPPLYKDKHGSPDLTGLHALLPINAEDRDMWLSCMEQAIRQQPIDEGFKDYLVKRFRKPAEKIYNWCQKQGIQEAPEAGIEILKKL